MTDIPFYTDYDSTLIREWLDAHGEMRVYRKGDCFCLTDTPVQYFGLIVSGCFAMERADAKGARQILSLAFNGEFVSSYVSYMAGVNSMFDVVSLERSVVKQVLMDDFYDFLRSVAPDYAFHMLAAVSQTVLSRCISIKCEAPSDRYLQLLRRIPDINQRISQSTLASYLGLTREAFSRMKRRLDEKGQ